MNVRVPNSVPSYHKMTVEEYKDMSFVPTKANLEKRRLEHAKATSPSQQQGRCVDNGGSILTDYNADQCKSMSDISEDPFSSATSTSPQDQANLHSSSRPEVGSVSGNFNAPTHVEVKRHQDTKRSRSFSKMIKGWVKKSSPPTIA